MDFEAAAKEFTRSAEGAEGDTAMARKRSRRVSFADTTAIHVFDRDEDYDTPPDLKPGAEGSSGAGLGSEPLGFYVDFTHNEDARSPSRREEDGDDHEEQDGGEEEHQLFVRRDADSSSPGSTAGSVMSNDGTKRKVLDFTLPNGKSSGVTGYSSDMTLVAENSRSYDYEKLPPTLEVLLAEVNEAMQPQNQNDMSSLLSCSPNMGTGPPAENKGVLKEEEEEEEEQEEEEEEEEDAGGGGGWRAAAGVAGGGPGGRSPSPLRSFWKGKKREEGACEPEKTQPISGSTVF
ncbi:hypothetical protein Taro_044104 [Colocasia esculenta]|uniref:Uncharacterized protein n=1 Tax=Colocasia esculenta TaxID=4460 RepID=A0A843WT50_COLES|nr:hypothetical protein [Colocasia esculenta]